uniref:Uncharacterized protein n=1 Tax=Panagrolaimus sp. JU765 TaxID=591449 RepID=A0AC34QSX0_9BILA
MLHLGLQKCEAGCGYDGTTGLFIPIKYVGNLRTKCFENKFGFRFDYKQNPFDPNAFGPNPFINYEDISHWVINDNPNLSKFMEFYFANYQTCEFAYRVECFTKAITAEESDNYPPEANHFVEYAYYGMRMLIFFDKENSRLFDSKEREEVLEKVWKGEQKLTKEQENAECSVLIFAKNPEDTTAKQMKMSEVLQFLVDFNNEKYPKVECYTKAITADESDNYPPEANHFVEDAYYGMRMLIFFDQQNSHLFHIDQRDKFLEKVWKGEEKLTKEQENAECSVLIFAKNPEDTTAKQMKVSEMLQFLVDLKNEKYPKYETLIYCNVFELTKRISVYNGKFQERMKLFGEKCFKSFEFLWNHKNQIEKAQQTDVTFGNANEMDSQTIMKGKYSFYSITDEQKTMLDVIKQQLEKIVKKNAMTAKKLSSIIQSIDNDDGLILDQLETLDLNNLDGGTADLINKFWSSLQ